jgi:hypothetical protein
MTETTETHIKQLNEVTRSLYAQFPLEMEKIFTVSGVELRFIPVSEVINRLNKVLGVDAWSSEIIKLERDQHEPDEIIAHVSLTAEIAGKKVVKHGVGGTSIKRIKSTGKPVDLGNSFKMAVSDALKKAAQQLGVGLYLSRSMDAIDAEEAMLTTYEEEHEEQHQVQHQVQQKTEFDEKWNNFVDSAKKLSADKKAELNSFWEKYSGGKPKPKKNTVTPEELDVLITEIIRLNFDGTYVDEQPKQQ